MTTPPNPDESQPASAANGNGTNGNAANGNAANGDGTTGEHPTGDAARDLQRSALRDLVALSTESAATEAKLEAGRVRNFAAATKELDRAKFSIRERTKGQEEAARKKHADQVARLEAAYSADVKKVEAEAAADMAKIEHENEPIARKLKEKHERDVWEAESVFDMAQAGHREEGKKAAEQHGARIKDLDSIVAEADTQLKSYSQPKPADAGGAAEGAAAGNFQALHQSAQDHLRRLSHLTVARLFAGVLPYVMLVFLCALAGAGGQFYKGGADFSKLYWKEIGIAAGGTFVLLLVLGFVLRRVARSQVLAAYRPLVRDVGAARAAAKAELDASNKAREAELAKLTRRRDKEVADAKQRIAPLVAKANAKKDAAVKAVKTKRETELARLGADRKRRRTEADEWLRKTQADLAEKQEVDLRNAQVKYDTYLRDVRRQYDKARATLEQRLSDGLTHIGITPQSANGDGEAAHAEATHAAGDGNGKVNGQAAGPAPVTWDDPAWDRWAPPRAFSPLVRIGLLHVDLQKIAEGANAEGTPQAVGEGAPGEEAAGDGAAVNAPAAGPAGETPAGNGSALAGPSKPKLKMPPAFDLPANLAFPRGASLLIQTGRDGRDQAIAMLQSSMARLLTWLPAGRVRFHIVDPVGLGQTFAGFMHLADYDDALIGGRVLTEEEAIDKRLADLTEHMETVIQKYLRNEFSTIDDYNQQAGELAEPYRFLVLADFPAGMTNDALRRLSSIAVTGPRCGVYTLVIRDTRIPLPEGNTLEDLEKASVNIVLEQPGKIEDTFGLPGVPALPPLEPRAEGEQGPRFVWADDVFRQFPLHFDPAPSEDQLTRIAHAVGKGAKEAKRVEVNFDTIAPRQDQFWTMSSASEMGVAVGRSGATRLQYLRLGKGVAQHVITAGKTGSGKSTLLHALVTNLAMWYSPDEVEFYLIDFKKGVEFKTYATQRLPHARAIAVESDREFGLSVLQRLDAELARRGDLYRKSGVQDLASYRKSAGALPMPRTLLLIDEFQEFFSEEDKLAAEASLLLDRLVRQGRAFGMHVFLGSQTIGGSSGLNRSTIGQMAVRIALMTSEADSQVILGDGNSAARLLTRPGEAIYNDQGGLVEANSPFQVAWLTDERREQFLRTVRAKADREAGTLGIRSDPIVFEGNAAADLAANVQLQNLLAAPDWPAPGVPRAWVGDPVAIKDPTAVTLRRNTGANVLIIGQMDEQALGILCAAMISLAAQHAPRMARFYVLDGTPSDSPLAGVLDGVRAVIPHASQSVEYRAVADAMSSVYDEVKRRQAAANDSAGDAHGGLSGEPEIYVVICGLQRYRALRKSEDSFGGSFSMDEEKKADPGKVFADLLREGPPVGVHVIAWCDTPIAVERTLDRGSLREFDNRVLFQMSASDSSNLIDSPLANKLGANRALAYSEEQGTVEKFRPYGAPNKELREQIKARLFAKPGTHDVPPIPAVQPGTPAGPAASSVPDESEELGASPFPSLGPAPDDSTLGSLSTLTELDPETIAALEADDSPTKPGGPT